MAAQTDSCFLEAIINQDTANLIPIAKLTLFDDIYIYWLHNIVIDIEGQRQTQSQIPTKQQIKAGSNVYVWFLEDYIIRLLKELQNQKRDEFFAQGNIMGYNGWLCDHITFLSTKQRQVYELAQPAKRTTSS